MIFYTPAWSSVIPYTITMSPNQLLSFAELLNYTTERLRFTKYFWSLLFMHLFFIVK